MQDLRLTAELRSTDLRNDAADSEKTTAKHSPVPLDAEFLHHVGGGTTPTNLPGNGW